MERKKTSFAIYRRLLNEARPYWLHIAGFFFLSLLAIPIALLTPLPLKIAVDSAIGSHPLPNFLIPLLPTQTTPTGMDMLLLVAGALLIIALLHQLQTLASTLLRTYAGEKLILAFRAKLFRQVQSLSLSYHDSKGSSDSTYRIQYDAPAIQWILIDGIIPLLNAGFTFAGMIIITAQINLKLALVALAVSPVLFLISHAYGRRLRGRWHEVYQLQSSAMSVVQEVVGAVRVVKAFGQEDREHDRFMRQSNRGVGARIRVALAEGAFGLLLGLTLAGGTAAVLFIGVLDVQSGALTLGGLLMVMTYLTQIYGPLEVFGKTATQLQGSLVCAERAFALLDEAPDVAEWPGARPLARAAGRVAFYNVSFGYGKDHQVLHDISFEIEPGARVGISGTTGAGKTTLVSLLTRFYDPFSGQILLDGLDLRGYRLADVRNQFAIVLQEPVLFSTTIAENIAYARPRAGMVEIIKAAKAAGAHDFISALPQGYETQVGERGMQLSGGERQRISLARAFLRDAPLLILDEPTSSVDLKTEAGIMEAMEKLMLGRTTFIIAHRLSTLKNCDMKLHIEGGRLVEVQRAAVSRTAAAPSRPEKPRADFMEERQAGEIS